MMNREQIRARNALKALKKYNHFKGKKGGDPLTGFPSLIVGNGLLAAIAFCKKNKGGHADMVNAVAEHLADSEISLLTEHQPNLDGLLTYLTMRDSADLRLCTAETLAYLNYLRRFSKSQEEGSEE